MSQASLPHMLDKPAAEICTPIALSKEATELLRDGLTPQQYVDLLIGQKHWIDAVRVMAHALPKRESVWWACVCARTIAPEAVSDPARLALEAAEAWVADPTEENRRAAMPAAEAAGIASPPGCAAAAAFWSGGSLAPPNLPAVPPADHLTAHGTSSSVLMAAVIVEPEKAETKYRAFLARGFEVADGKNRWKTAVAAAPASTPPPAPAARPEKGPSRPVIDWG